MGPDVLKFWMDKAVAAFAVQGIIESGDLFLFIQSKAYGFFDDDANQQGD